MKEKYKDIIFDYLDKEVDKSIDWKQLEKCRKEIKYLLYKIYAEVDNDDAFMNLLDAWRDMYVAEKGVEYNSVARSLHNKIQSCRFHNNRDVAGNHKDSPLYGLDHYEVIEYLKNFFMEKFPDMYVRATKYKGYSFGRGNRQLIIHTFKKDLRSEDFSVQVKHIKKYLVTFDTRGNINIEEL